MNIERHIILVKEEDKTKEIINCEYENGKYHVTFQNNKTYDYGFNSIRWERNPNSMDPKTNMVYIDNQPVLGLSKILIFDHYARLIFGNFSQIYHLSVISIRESVINEKNTNILNYFKRVSDFISVKDENEVSFLRNQYEKLNYIDPTSVLSFYIGENELKRQEKISNLIFPFGFNLSQKRAVENAFNNQLSIIEGPPGTGKTQTILNIIINAVINHKTVAIVSNNNSATANVIEKLKKLDFNFFCAYLGNKMNKELFYSSQNGIYPASDGWKLKNNEIVNINNENKIIQQELDQIFYIQNTLAKLKQDLINLKTEYGHFVSFISGNKTEYRRFKINSNLTSNQILELILDIEQSLNPNGKFTFIFKLRSFFNYRFTQYKTIPPEVIISELQQMYYEKRKSEIEEQIKQYEDRLEKFNFDEKLKRYTDNSIKVFRNFLAEQYPLGNSRRLFNQSDLWKNFDSFIREYPVILSTTHSLRTSIKQNYLFDFLIVDEASQVDIITGALALSCAKQAIIVGDTKQLPNVLSSEQKEKINTLFKSYQINEFYNASTHSLLASMIALSHDIPRTLLREHYRCHPLIIGFCNQKFYNNQLIVLTDTRDNDKPLSLYVTAEGNHARGTFNQRQIDVIINEILPDIKNKESIGVISPYREHAQKLQEVLDKTIEADTIHKFQGREKDIIILTTVGNDVNEFIDDANLINVAVSRAVSQLYVVVANGIDKKAGTNIGDLIRYIKYNNLEIVESKIYSAFDLLYSEYSNTLLSRFKKIEKVSDFQSENIINDLLETILKKEEFLMLGKIMHQPFRMLLKDTSILTLEELQFAMNPLTHTDFLIFNKIDKTTVLVIEVDGYGFHDMNEKQSERDKKKDTILKRFDIPILRLKTNESNEEERIINTLRTLV